MEWAETEATARARTAEEAKIIVARERGWACYKEGGGFWKWMSKRLSVFGPRTDRKTAKRAGGWTREGKRAG